MKVNKKYQFKKFAKKKKIAIKRLIVKSNRKKKIKGWWNCNKIQFKKLSQIKQLVIKKMRIKSDK